MNVSIARQSPCGAGALARVPNQWKGITTRDEKRQQNAAHEPWVRSKARQLETQKAFLNPQNKNPASIIEAGSVSTQASARLRTVAHCSPEPFAAIVPAIPDDNT